MGGGYGMGPGMMGGGYGMGPGMMGGGYGMGPGMMGGAWGALTPDQQAKVDTITRDVRRRADEIAERAFAQTNRMRELQLAPQRDSKALSDAYRKLLDLRQQRFDLMLGWRDQFDQLLAEAQKDVPKR
jgi:Spy/CpxP family protein refolding chaperone